MDEIQIAEFWSHVDKRGPDECWLWTGTRWKNGGYGRFSQFKAHRIAYELTNGPISALTLVRHGCDNPPCCNPRHLVLGTSLENMTDKRVRGRSAQQWGERHGLAMLSDVECDDIRNRFDGGESAAAIHKTSYSHVSYGSVWAIARRLVRTNGSGLTHVATSGAFWGKPQHVTGQHANAVISDADVRAIRVRYLAGETAKSIHAISYSHVSYGCISRICSGRRRANVA